MRVYLDDQDLGELSDTASAIDAARDKVEGSGRTIVDILADGEPAPDSVFDDDQDSGDIGELRFQTVDTKAFLTETVETARESIGLLRADQKQAAELIKTSEMNDALETLRSILEGWQAVRDIVDQVAQLADLDISALTLSDGTKGEEPIHELTKALDEIKTSIQSQDWASLGDVIEYDLEELATRWDHLLTALKTAADRG